MCIIAWEGVKFGINFTSCSENGNVIAQGLYLLTDLYKTLSSLNGILNIAATLEYFKTGSLQLLNNNCSEFF